MGGAFSVNTAKAAKPRVEHGATVFWVSGIEKLDGTTVRPKPFRRRKFAPCAGLDQLFLPKSPSPLAFPRDHLCRLAAAAWEDHEVVAAGDDDEVAYAAD